MKRYVFNKPERNDSDSNFYRPYLCVWCVLVVFLVISILVRMFTGKGIIKWLAIFLDLSFGLKNFWTGVYSRIGSFLPNSAIADLSNCLGMGSIVLTVSAFLKDNGEFGVSYLTLLKYRYFHFEYVALSYACAYLVCIWSLAIDFRESAALALLIMFYDCLLILAIIKNLFLDSEIRQKLIQRHHQKIIDTSLVDEKWTDIQIALNNVIDNILFDQESNYHLAEKLIAHDFISLQSKADAVYRENNTNCPMAVKKSLELGTGIWTKVLSSESLKPIKYEVINTILKEVNDQFVAEGTKLSTLFSCQSLPAISLVISLYKLELRNGPDPSAPSVEEAIENILINLKSIVIAGNTDMESQSNTNDAWEYMFIGWSAIRWLSFFNENADLVRVAEDSKTISRKISDMEIEWYAQLLDVVNTEPTEYWNSHSSKTSSLDVGSQDKSEKSYVVERIIKAYRD